MISFPFGVVVLGLEAYLFENLDIDDIIFVIIELYFLIINIKFYFLFI